MTRRKRNLLLGTIVLLLVAVEVAYWNLATPVACVSIVNQGSEPIENLRLECAGGVVRAGRVEVGATANVFMAARGKQTLKVSYRLKGSALTGFDLTTFDPSELQREGFRLVLVIRQDEWERYQDDAEPSLMASLAGQAHRWLEKSLESP